MIDIDYSFLRLRDNIKDAKNLNKVSINEFDYIGQVHLIPSEVYLQITNSPTPINLSSWEAHLVDICGNEIEDITDNIFIEPFIDTNGKQQISWEMVVNFDYNFKALIVRFTETSNGDQWFSNPFIATAYGSEDTIRFDYKNNLNHYGTQYNRANYKQSIRLNGWFKNKINESERSEYHQITTDITVPTRNIKKIKNRYELSDYDGWTIERIENMITSNELYLDSVRMYSTTAIEFIEGEGSSNISIHEMSLNPDYNQTFNWSFQIFEGFELIERYVPDGSFWNPTAVDPDLFLRFSTDIELLEGEIKIFTEAGVLLQTYTTSDMNVVADTLTVSGVYGFGYDIATIGNYYITVSPNLVRGFGIIEWSGITNSTGWTFRFLDGMYDGTMYDNSQYLT